MTKYKPFDRVRLTNAHYTQGLIAGAIFLLEEYTIAGNAWFATVGPDAKRYLLFESDFELVVEDMTPTTGTKHDGGKAPMELLSPEALEEIAHVFGFGAKKYGRHNYHSGIAYSRLISAASRHLNAFNKGVTNDIDSNLPHIAHLAACAIMLLDMVREHPHLDDRRKRKPTSS